MNPPSENIKSYVWEIGADGRTAIIGHNGKWHVLTACDTFNNQVSALRRLHEIESAFEYGKTDRPAYMTDLFIAADRALPFIAAMAPSNIVTDLQRAIDKARPK